MVRLEESELGTYWVDEKGELYELIAYCLEPTVCWKEIKTGKRIDVAARSPIANKMKKLVVEEG